MTRKTKIQWKDLSGKTVDNVNIFLFYRNKE